MMEIRVRFLAVALSAATLFAPAVAQEKQGGEKKEGEDKSVFEFHVMLQMRLVAS